MKKLNKILLVVVIALASVFGAFKIRDKVIIDRCKDETNFSTIKVRKEGTILERYRSCYIVAIQIDYLEYSYKAGYRAIYAYYDKDNIVEITYYRYSK